MLRNETVIFSKVTSKLFYEESVGFLLNPNYHMTKPRFKLFKSKHELLSRKHNGRSKIFITTQIGS